MSRSVRTDYTTLVSRSRRQNVLAFIAAMKDELRARTAFKEEATPETLTAWADARNTLEDRKQAL